jgi:hypothetical protein
MYENKIMKEVLFGPALPSSEYSAVDDKSGKPV